MRKELTARWRSRLGFFWISVWFCSSVVLVGLKAFGIVDAMLLLPLLIGLFFFTACTGLVFSALGFRGLQETRRFKFERMLAGFSIGLFSAGMIFLLIVFPMM